MIETIVNALLPIAIILLLGYFAGYHHDFNKDQAAILNRMVMLYALPLSLFSGLITISLDELLHQKALIASIFIGMIVFYFIVYIILKYLIKQPINKAALLSLAITGPAVPFVGVSVLGQLFGNLSTIPISLASIYMNLIQVPVTLILLSLGNENKINGKTDEKKLFLSHIISALKEPVVWAPMLALVLLLMGIRIPKSFVSSFELLGKATGGVALFASGIVLFSYKVSFNKTVINSVLAKNILVPLVLWLVLYLFNFSSDIIRESVITISIPTASIAIILSIQYKIQEKNISSILFISTLFSIITMGIFLAILPK